VRLNLSAELGRVQQVGDGRDLVALGRSAQLAQRQARPVCRADITCAKPAPPRASGASSCRTGRS
jgi:hypothetical protein